MAHSGAEDSTTPREITQQPSRVTFDLAAAARRYSPDSRMDEELQALGLWEEDMTEGQKADLLRVVAVSRETAKREEAVRKSKLGPAQQPVLPVSIESQERPYWDQKSTAEGSNLTSPECSDDEWPKHSGARQCMPYRRHPLAVKVPARRVYCMDQHVDFEWGRGDEPELEDARLSRLSSGTRSLPARDLMADVGAGDLPSPAKHDNAADRLPASGPKADWTSPPALLESWSAMHISLKKAQSVPGLPMRPWGCVTEAPPLLCSQSIRAPTFIYGVRRPEREEAARLINCALVQPYGRLRGQGPSFLPFCLPRPERSYQSSDYMRCRSRIPVRRAEVIRPMPGRSMQKREDKGAELRSASATELCSSSAMGASNR